ncbi:DUF6161 domain-containing protein [Roseibium sp. HPY-6]|uniref:DUF6161 domain-containing protein n=1 Tax=Roseibium sp. HPY-6 TaxID=3229852 RepID=UPI00338EA4AA
MLQTTRMLAWISFFQKIRVDETVTDDSDQDANANPEPSLSGADVFLKLVPPTTRVGSVPAFKITKFRDFDPSEIPLPAATTNDTGLRRDIVMTDLVAISLECAEAVVLPEEIWGLLGDKKAAENLSVLYLSLKACVIATEPDLFQKQKGKFEKHFEKMRTNNAERTRAVVKSAQQEIEKEIEDLRGTLSKELEEERKKVESAAKEAIEKYKREAGATLIVKGANDLWGKKLSAHRWIFGVSALAFVLVVVGTISFSIFFRTEISDELLKLEPLFQGHVFGAVVLVLIPVLGIAWVLRLLSRFTTQNMMLADDAQLRRVMAETYVKLVSENAIKEPEDRAIILSALFRPLPGTGAEDVSPPSITDILKGKN